MFGQCLAGLALLLALAQPSLGGPVFDEEALEAMLLQVDPWPSSPDRYSQASWENLIRTAKTIQECDPVSVEKVLNDFQNEQKNINDVDGKLFILMRIIFDLPEHSERSKDASFGDWVTRRGNDVSDVNPDGTTNLSWPVSWATGRPQLISGFQGARGRPYDAAKEYHYLRTEFTLRNLLAVVERTRQAGLSNPELKLRNTFVKQGATVVSIAQCARMAKDAAQACEPSLNWESLSGVNALIDPADGKGLITVTFSFSTNGDDCVVKLQPDGEVAGVARKRSATSSKTEVLRKEAGVKVYQGVVPPSPAR